MLVGVSGRHLYGRTIVRALPPAFGLQEKYFLNALDNAPGKIGRRLYGTNLTVKSPKFLQKHDEAIVVLTASIYTDEIKKDILEKINPNILFC